MTRGENLYALEAAHGGPFRFKHRGVVYTIPGPETLQIHEVMGILEAEVIPGTPHMARWKRTLLFERWVGHYDLPTLPNMQRLVWVIDRHRAAIEVDLPRFYNGLDLNTLWRQRRFRYLLNLIDHLPQHSYYSAAVADDPEHADALAKAQAERKKDSDEEDPGPPLHHWTPEMAGITKLIDATRHVAWMVAAVQAEKGKTPKHPEPEPRPKTYLDRAKKRAQHEARKAKHQSLVKRMLPHKG